MLKCKRNFTEWKMRSTESESGDCGLLVVYIPDVGAMLWKEHGRVKDKGIN